MELELSAIEHAVLAERVARLKRLGPDRLTEDESRLIYAWDEYVREHGDG